MILKQKSLQAENCWSCSDVVLHRLSMSVPLVLLWLSYGALKWIRSAFEEGPKVMRRYANRYKCIGPRSQIGYIYEDIIVR